MRCAPASAPPSVRHLHVLAVTLIAAPLVLPAAGLATALEIGDAAPAFDLPACDAEAARVSSDHLFDSGPATLLVFWNTDCPDCLADLVATAEAVRSDTLGLACLAICTEVERIGDARRLLRGLDLGLPCAWDVHGLAADRYGTTGLSYAAVLVDRAGTVQYVTRDHPESIDAELAAIWRHGAALRAVSTAMPEETDVEVAPDSSRRR
jgi:peroxiredoxin